MRSLMPLNSFHRDIIDSAINDTLTGLLVLPKEDGIKALAELFNLSMMPNDAVHYPPLPSLFQNPAYQSKEVQDSLKQLCEIMYSRQPQNAVKHSNDQGSEVAFGKFGLVSRAGENITAKDVREYLKYKFALAAYHVIAFERAVIIINNWKNDIKNKSLYYKYFAEWIKTSPTETIPSEIREIILSNGILKRAITKAFQTEEKNLKLFSPYSDNVEVEKIIPYLLSLSPDVFDSEMTSCFHTLFFSTSLVGKKLQVLQQDPYQSVQKKLQNQITKSDKTFLNLRSVTLSFVLVAKAQEVLNLYGDVIQLDDAKGVEEVSRIAEKYIPHLNQCAAEKQESLGANETEILKEFLSKIEPKKTFGEWIGNFFALYFTAEQNDKNTLLRKIFDFALNTDKLCINDEWLIKIYKKQFDRQAGVVNITPYHVNRVLLHALTTPVEKWSEIYYDIFARLLDLLNTTHHPDNNLFPLLKRDSYSNEFQEQLRWLQNQYQRYIRPAENPVEQPKTIFPMLYYPKDSKALSNTLRLLSPEQCKVVYESMKDNLPDIIKTGEDFCNVLTYLSAEQRKAVYNNMKDKLPNIIKTGRDFYDVLAYLSAEQCNAVYESMKDKLSDIIKTKKDFNDFIDVLTFLSAEQCKAVCESIKDNLLDIIKSALDFRNILRYLHSEKGYTIYEVMKDKLPGIINSTSDFNKVLHYLSAEQCKAVCESVEHKLSDIITSPNELTLVIGEDPKNLKTYFLNKLLISFLDKYKSEEERNNDKYHFYGFYSKKEEIDDAVNALKESINNNTLLDPKYISALSNGSLGKIINKYLETYRPDVKIDEFLKKKPVPSSANNTQRRG